MDKRKDIPEFAAFTPDGAEAKVMRPSVNGKVKFSRLPIRRRQLKNEISNFVNWIERIWASEQEMFEKDASYFRFFSEDRTALLIVGIDGKDLVHAEIGTPEKIERLMKHITETLPLPHCPVTNKSKENKSHETN